VPSRKNPNFLRLGTFFLTFSITKNKKWLTGERADWRYIGYISCCAHVNVPISINNDIWGIIAIVSGIFFVLTIF
jgi:hypothetical protein